MTELRRDGHLIEYPVKHDGKPLPTRKERRQWTRAQQRAARRARRAAAVSAVLVAGALLAGCTGNTDNAQRAAQNTTETLSTTAQHAVPYPLPQMQAGGFLERTELKEHLLRQNDKNALRYIVLMTQMGQVIAQYSLAGMVFDPNSQLTNTQSIENGSFNSATYSGVVDAPGDNGTWGPEAGSAAFYTTANVEIQIPQGVAWIESDSPLNITTTPLVTLNANATPSTNHGGAPAGGH